VPLISIIIPRFRNEGRNLKVLENEQQTIYISYYGKVVMKNLKRFLILQFLFLFILPITFADIIIKIPEKDVYNLGEKIAAVVSIKEDKDYNGFFSMEIICGNYTRKYYTIPLGLEAGFRTQLTVPDLSLSKYKAGDCTLKSNFEAGSGESIDTAESASFMVTDKINLNMDKFFEAKPGEDIIISGEARKESDEILKKGRAEISFMDKNYGINVTSGKFEYMVHLDDDAETGIVPIAVIVEDKNGNYGNKILSLKLNPIPTRIVNNLGKGILIPGDNLRANIILYDHTNKVMKGNISVKVFDLDNGLIAEKGVQSSDNFEFVVEKNLVPGSYLLLSEFENIEKQDSFVIGVFRKITMKLQDNFVYIENVGNVEYDDEVTLTLQGDEKNYLINKEINLVPGEKIIIDLSKEVPQGIYDVILPEEAVEEDDTNGEENENIEDMPKKNVIENVSIEDNRDVIKKTSHGMSSITGVVVGAADYVASRPTLAAFILIFIILGTVMRYSWGFIKNRAMGKKEETEHIFDDFKFDENEDSKPRH
jgi:hypothetical protein